MVASLSFFYLGSSLEAPERLHHADSGGDIHCFAGVALPAVKTPTKAYEM